MSLHTCFLVLPMIPNSSVIPQKCVLLGNYGLMSLFTFSLALRFANEMYYKNSKEICKTFAVYLGTNIGLIIGKTWDNRTKSHKKT